MSASCEAINGKGDRAVGSPSASANEIAGGAGSLLPKIQDLSFLRMISRSVLADVADELRAHLIGLGSRIGGHFAGSHGAESKLIERVPVYEQFQGETVWEGEVLVFELIDHLEAARCYAWEVDGRVTAVLHEPPAGRLTAVGSESGHCRRVP